MVDPQFLLYTLNEYLARTALLVQPLKLPTTGSNSGGGGSHSQLSAAEAGGITTIDVPLPLAGAGVAGAAEAGRPGSSSQEDAAAAWNPFEAPSNGSNGGGLQSRATGYLASGEAQEVLLPPGLAPAPQYLGLGGSLGYLRLLLEPTSPSPGEEEQQPEQPAPQRWLPLALCLGMPMQPTELCEAVCSAAQAAAFLDARARQQQREGQGALQAALNAQIAQHGACSTCFVGGGRDDDLGSFVDRPTRNLLFSGGKLAPLDLSAAAEGVPLLPA